MKIFSFKVDGDLYVWYLFGIRLRFKRKLKQDSTSQVEFYLIDSFEIFHFIPLYNNLKENGINVKIVAEPCHINTSGTWFDYDTAIRILKQYKVDYVELANPNALLAITTQRNDVLKRYKNKKANLSYGFGFTKDYFINSIDTLIGFDYRFVHGSIQEDMLKKFNMPIKFLQIGYPKHMDFFTSNITRDDVLNELKINTNKKILVYYPTWDEESSISDLYSQIKDVKNEYFIVTKPHHCTFRLDDKKDDLKLISEISDVVLDGNYDFAKSALIGDVAIVDAKSGAATEVPFLNENIKLLLFTKSSSESYVDLIYQFAHIASKGDDVLFCLKNIDSCDTLLLNRKNIIPNIYKKINFNMMTLLEEVIK